MLWENSGAALRRSWVMMAGVVWLAGVACLGLLMAANYLLLLWGLRRCRPAPVRWACELERLCHEMAVNVPLRLELHTRLGPFLCWTPRGRKIVVPALLWSRLKAAERIAVLHHELCHLRRGDLWKSLLARLVVSLHWFNPLAWLAGRRYDECAEWSCDAMMAREAPCRLPPLAKALLMATRSAEISTCGALPVSGGPVFRRIRRLLDNTPHGDGMMRKIWWMMGLAALALLAVLRPQHVTMGDVAAPAAQPPSPQAAAEDGTRAASLGQGEAETAVSVRDDALAAAQAPAGGSPEEAGEGELYDVAGTGSVARRLEELAQRIVVGENEVLKRFVEMLQTEAGRVVMADRMALAVQNAADDEATAAPWDTFVASRFEERGSALVVRPEHERELAVYRRRVELGNEAVQQMTPVFQEVAAALAAKSDAAAMLKRFLLHEASCAAVYYHELRSGLHPDVQDVQERMQDLLVRTAEGRYVIRPARRAAAAQTLAQAERLASLMDSLHQELRAWAEELVDEDGLHKQLKEALRSKPFAEFLTLRVIEDPSRITEQNLEDVYWHLEEATDDVAAGLRLNTERDACRNLLQHVEHFRAVWQQRQALREPLDRLIELLEERDELHVRFKKYLQSEHALIGLAADMEYLPRSAAEAAREWLSHRVAKNDADAYELAVESPEQLMEELAYYFTEFREVRRRGRSIDMLAKRLQDQTLQQAMQSYLGKLLLRDLARQAATMEQPDALQLWIDEYFDETTEGLVLRDWAVDVIAEVIDQARELEAQLQQTDF
jgi:beta-lactamase regulating signal transducer with metallopeptidase domain